MTDRHVPQPEILDRLDERAARAVTDLDRVLSADAEPPPFAEREGDPSTSRRPLPILPLVAAAIVVVALVGLAVTRLGPGDDQSTIAGEPDRAATEEFVRLALPDPGTTGHQIIRAYDGVARPSPAESPLSGLTHSIQGPADADDPWTAAVIAEGQDSAPDERLWGQVVDLGDRDGAINFAFPGVVLHWLDGDRSLQLVSRTAHVESITELARRAITEGWRGDGPLPGHVVLHENGGWPSALVYVGPRNPLDAATVVYEGTQGRPSFVLGTVPGGDACYRSMQIFHDPAQAEDVEIRGRPGVILAGPWSGQLRQILWRENDGTIGWVETYDDTAEVIALLDLAVTLDAAGFGAVVDEHPATADQPLLEPPPGARPGEMDPFNNRPEDVVAELDADTGSATAEMVLYRDPSDQYWSLGVLITDSTGGTGSGSSVTDLSRPAATWTSSSGIEVIAGLVPSRPVSATVSFGDGPALPIRGLVATPIEGTTSFAYLAWDITTPEHQAGTHPALFTIVLDDGEIIRIAI